MNRSVTYKRLWLVSARDEKARKQEFAPKTLLLGTNGTGKSRVVKNLYWVFGCNTLKRNAGSWDTDTVVGLEFCFKGNEYLVLREGKRLAMFGAGDVLLFSAENMAAWDRHLSNFFEFRLRLKRPKHGTVSQAGPDYLLMPFYMDQDGSWGPGWSTFENATQFTDWKTSTFEAFIGMRPNTYFEAKHQSDEIGSKLSDKRKELESQRQAFKRVHDVLPKNLPTLNIAAFRSELAELGRNASKLQQDQVKIRAQLLGLVNTRQQVQSELKLALGAYEELRGDFSYLADRSGAAIECPTCGTIHENSFHARLQLSNDAESLAALVAELRNQADSLFSKENVVRSSLRTVEKEITQLDHMTGARRAKLRLDDVLASQSKRALDTAFQQVTTELNGAVRKLEGKKDIADAQVKKFLDPQRTSDVKKYFSEQVLSLSSLLNVPPDEQIPDVKAGARAQAGGSSAPRSMLAVHLAMLASNAEWGDSPMFPFVVDTPAQSGQDDENLGKMIYTLGKAAGINHQVILAAERLPEGVELGGFETVDFFEKKSALKSEGFAEAVLRLQGPLISLRESLKPKIEAMP